ncbi:hypothetical protein F0562_009864 [Nyssa sinensis]|uniref:non-specific serine/threonine protein kinase n=1 Tax=Nyssa sinensis TaxID=561372 RepID=A0A5J5A1Z5_9ASTE|nr:hypothetical protein F0562_009864 [Nyssa sinensis]
MNILRVDSYFDSSGVSGGIPSTFAALENLQTVWASDTELTGSIPEFIGNWSRLTTLRLQGNSFEGPIPSSFSNLTSLTDLRISDLSNGSSSLQFLMDMKSLAILVLRNNNLSGSIPANIGEYQSLSRIIPDSLFNLSSLSYLFLGNNKLTGTLPVQKSTTLLNIDLSYNELSGSFPSWVSQQDLQLNLVANNFTIGSSNTSGLPSGLSCLQRNFLCNRGSPIYYNFAIKWAVSNVGRFADSNNPQYTSFSSSQFTNTLDSELFQTARISPGSLRYYGLGLENGNYNVSLQFAEIAILNPPTWRSLGRRVFDVYIQGNLVLKDFDIRREAAGASFRAVQKDFQAQVSENYLEIHLFWAGKGTCCIPSQGTYGPSISAISATPDFNPTVSNNPPSSKKNRTSLIVGIAVAVGVVSFLSVFALYCFVQRRRRPPSNEDEELLGMDARPYTFSYAELRASTEDFSPANKLGEGGFGPVYKGTLNDGRVVAVKQLSVASHQGKSQFVTEIATISAVQHRNLVKLYGCCIEGDKRLLVYEFLENKSLDQALFGKRSLQLDWPTRYDICLGVARGLAYLHEESRVRIVHRDVKASNILLDSDLNPKISDFGLAKLYDDKKTHISTRVAGTIGYLAPEYAMRGHLTEKADVFGFGVVALEIISGRPNSDSSLEEEKIYLLEWAWHLHENDREVELTDSNLSEFNEEEVKRMIGIALLCTQTSPTMRPSMSRVVAMLSGDIEAISTRKMKLMARSTSICCIAFFYFVFLFCLVDIAQAQNQTNTTDPAEVRALNSIFQQWGIQASWLRWNISGELCTGAATDDSAIDISILNPGIKCDCSIGSTCHITALKVYALDVIGVIPDELWTLTFLTNLNLGQNYLTGRLSASIGNLTRLQYLNLGINALSGELPKELGKLSDLRSLSFGSNNFSGPLPSELGNLTALEQLYFDSSGVSGGIPSTFAALKNLQTVWASDTELTGSIPEFIGNWSRLTVLRFQGNSFEGPIPSSFSNLTSLTDLRISDLSNGSSSLEFLRDMTSLTSLVLRNNNISGSIPANIGEYQSLSQLDLSFNNLIGEIPDPLFNLISLFYLFLGNNKLTGSLPAQKSTTLLNIQQDLQLNLVANNFTIGSSNSSVLPSGLRCLQRNFPCSRGSPIYYDFAINCGGPAIMSSNQIVYERDYETLGPATYYVTNTTRWAVSNVGRFAESNNLQYTNLSSFQFTNTSDSDLFQTIRISPGSLRYYGLGLENGNYNVSLQFAEIGNKNPPTWRSLGRRVFDVYIQGNLVLKDFDIRREAAGAFLQAVQMDFQAQVSENYLEIHLFWAGKGTCCIPFQGTYGPSVSAISATRDFNPTVSNNTPSIKKNRTGLIVGIVVSVGVVSFLSVFVLYYFVQRRRRPHSNEDEELIGMDARPYTFSYAELGAATEDFSPANKLGEGGFGPVYKGTLNDGRVVAVKQLSVASHQGKSQFVTEIITISVVQHRNLVKLYGCCIEGDKRLLVYEFLENRSLDQALFGNRSLQLDWPTRYDICLGVARGLAYLHEESRLRIVHRDVKASNILLDFDLKPKISDFGLAKLYDDKKTHISTRVAGTIGYLAPEYAMRGHLTEKADVFGFGVVALEILSGRPNFDSSWEEEKIYLLEWAWHLHENYLEVELVDSNLSDFNEEEVKRVMDIALLCTQTSPTLRPSMSRVVAMLSGDIDVSTVTTRPGYLTDWKFNDTTSFMSSNASTSQNPSSHHNSSTSTDMVADADRSPVDATRPMLDEIIGEGSGVGFHGKRKLLSMGGIPTSIALYVSCFGGHPVIPTVYMSMQDRGQFTKAMLVSFFFNTIVYLSMAIVGYLMYGNNVDSLITLNLPTEEISSKVALYTTLVIPVTRYALVVSPVANAIESGPLQCYRDTRRIRLLIRISILVSTTMVACAFPYFEFLMAVVGSTLVVFASFLLPCCCYLKISRGYQISRSELTSIIGIIVLGIFAGIIGTYASIAELVQKM